MDMESAVEYNLFKVVDKRTRQAIMRQTCSTNSKTLTRVYFFLPQRLPRNAEYTDVNNNAGSISITKRMLIGSAKIVAI